MAEYIIPNGVTSSGLLIQGDDTMYVQNGGSASATTVNATASMYVQDGGTADLTTVNQSGSVAVQNGGVATATTVNYFGSLYVSDGGVATGVTVNNYGNVDVSQGGKANSIIANTSGYVWIEGGSASSIAVSGGWVQVNSASGIADDIVINGGGVGVRGTVNSTLVSGYGNMIVGTGGIANSTVLSYGSMHVSNGGTANGVTVAYGGRMYVSNGGVVNDVRTDESGSMWIYNGGTMNNVVLSGFPYYPYFGTLNVSAGGVANNVYVKYGGHINVYSGGTATLAFDPWRAGTVNVSAGGTAIYLESDAKVYYGSNWATSKGDYFSGLEVEEDYDLFVYSGGSVDATILGNGGSMHVSNGGMANKTVMNYGNLFIHEGGRADSTTVNAYNYAYVYSGGTANSTILNSGGVLHISGGTANEVTLNSSARLAVSLGGAANSVTVADHATVSVSENGVVNSVTVDPGGALYFYGAEATAIVENGGYVAGNAENMIFTPNAFSNVVLGDGIGSVISEGGYYTQATVHSGTTAVSTTVNNWAASLEVFSGGTALSTLVNSGYMYVSGGGSARDVTMNSSGYLTLWGGEATGVTVNSSGCLILGAGGTANNVNMTNSGRAYVSSGGTANEVMMGGSSFLTVYAGGTASIAFNPFQGWYASGIVYSSAGAEVTYLERDANVYYGNWSSGVISKADVFDNVAISDYHSAHVYEGGTVNSATLESGGIYVSGGELNDLVIDRNGWVNVSSGTVNRAIVNSRGYLEISSGAAGTEIIENGGGVWFDSDVNVTIVPNVIADMELSGATATVHSGTTATGTLLGSGGYLNVYSGGSAAGTTVGSSGGLTVNEGGLANTVAVDSAGTMYVYGTATAVTENGGYIYVGSDADVTFAPNTLNNLTWSGYVSATVHSNTSAISNSVGSGAGLYVYSGATATDTAVSSGYLCLSGGTALGTVATMGSLYVYEGGVLKSTTGSGTTVYISSGGLAEDTVVTVSDWDMYMYVSSGGSAKSTVLNGIRMYVSSGATATDTTLNYYDPTNHTAGINVSSGGRVDTVTVNSGCYLYVSEGAAAGGVTAGADGIVGISGGATLTGRVNIAEGATVYVLEGGRVDFGLYAAGGPGTEALINDLSLIQGTPDFTLTVTPGQAAGTYDLAAGVTDFTKTVLVGLPDGSVLGEIGVGGEFATGTKSFQLTKTDDLLSFTITNEVRTDFLQNGVSQILAWDAEQGKVGYTATDGNPAPAWKGLWEWSTSFDPDLGASEAELWRVVGAGHFAGSTVDCDGVLLYNGIGNTFAAWTDLNDPSYGYVSLCHVEGNFRTKTLTDLDGDDYDDVLIYDEKGSFGVVLGAAEYHDIWHVEDPASNVIELVGAGSFGALDSMDSLLVRNTQDNSYFLWHNNDPTFGTWDWSQTYIGTLDEDWTVAAIGDFSGDGMDDIAMWRASTGEIQIWENGQASNQRYAGTLDQAGWEVAAVGDYNCDGREDLLLRETSTGWGGLGYWASADAPQWADLNARIETDMESKFAIIA